MINLQNFKMQRLIGEGSFGNVYEVIETNSKVSKKYAAKISNREIKENSSETVESIINELSIISKLNHPSIVKFIGYNLNNFENEPMPTIIMELASNNSLRHMINLSQKPPQWNLTKKIINIFGIASGMSYLHSHKVLHHDLKPENILLDDYLFPKIADFNLSKIRSDISQTNFSKIRGTPLYMSPESFHGEYSYATDVYSFGIIIYEILIERNPFQGLSVQNYLKIVSENGFKPNFPDNFPDPYKNLIIKCGSLISGERPKFSEIVQAMKSDRQFILKDIDEGEYLDYIKIIEEYQATFCSNKITTEFSDFIKSKNPTIEKVSIQKYESKSINIEYPYENYIKLSEENKQLVDNANDDPRLQYFIGKSSIENQNGFPMDTVTGLEYLKKSIKSGYKESIIYYSNILIQDQIIHRNLEKAKKLLNRILFTKKAEVYALYGKILRKEKNYSQAIEFFIKAIDRGSGKAMNNYGKMLLNGEGCEPNEQEALTYFKMAERNNYKNASKHVLLLTHSISNTLSLKVILVGASGVGKTWLLNAMRNKPNYKEGLPTIFCNLNTIVVPRDNETIVKLCVYDTAGQERYQSFIPDIYYRESDICFVCYSFLDHTEIDKLVRKVREYSPNCKIFLVETKVDALTEEQRNESLIQGEQLKNAHNCYMHIMTSSTTKEGVDILLKQAANISISKSEQYPKPVKIDNSQSNEVEVANKRCKC